MQRDVRVRLNVWQGVGSVFYKCSFINISSVEPFLLIIMLIIINKRFYGSKRTIILYCVFFIKKKNKTSKIKLQYLLLSLKYLIIDK